MNTNDVLLKAAERLRTRGWFGRDGGGQGEECAMIAISEVVREEVEYRSREWAAHRAAARDQLLQFVGVHPTGEDSTLWDWNDKQLNSEAVIAAMVAAATGVN